MNFNSLEFLLFFPIVLIIYWILPQRIRWGWLLCSSYFFYMSWNAVLLLPILMTTFISYTASILIEKNKSKLGKKIVFLTTIFFCLGTLFFFKYFNFAIENVSHLLQFFHMKISIPSLNIMLPVGISFYTFQTMSYVIDVYRGTVKAEYHLGYYALYISFFPQLVAGPIERSSRLLSQFRAEHKWSKKDFEIGIRYTLSGFFRKIVVADTLGIYVNRVFGNLEEANALAVLIAGVMFCFQMYCDFAGYSEIALGTGRMLGIKLMKNFDRPYLSTSYTEFFQRWHISLSQWFSDYVYIPLGGNRKGSLCKIRNTFIVFILCGLWHGARWNYILWGIYAAFWISLESVCEGKKNRDNCPKQFAVWKMALQRIGIFGIFIPAALFFRASDMKEIRQVVCKLIAGSWNVSKAVSLLQINQVEFATICLIFICMYFLYYMCEYSEVADLPQEIQGVVRKERIQYSARAMTYILIILSVVFSSLFLYSGGEIRSFAYFQF